MNQNLILRIVGVILCIEALCMIPPLLLSVFGGGVDQRAFLYALLICGGVGVLLSLIRADNARLQTRDGFVCVALCWIALSVFGALPYFFSGSCSFIDAIFETVSGLTTTGASIFPSPASLPQGIQFWRALTQWMGGMGILVLMLALLPKLSEGSVNLMKAESPGPISTKLRPRTGETARILYRIYIALTVAEALLLRIAGLQLFDAITTALTTISTGGFVHPGCEHRVLSVASCQLDPHFLHVCRKRELYAPLPLRDTPLPRGAQERGAARLLAGRGRRVGDDRGGPDRAHGARHRLGHRECGLSGNNAHFNDRLLHGGF